jgi:hypothetical protein
LFKEELELFINFKQRSVKERIESSLSKEAILEVNNNIIAHHIGQATFLSLEFRVKLKNINRHSIIIKL